MSRYDPRWVIRYYDAYGDKEWHRWEGSPADEAKFHVHQYWLKRYVRRGDFVLEVGAGAGRFTQVLAQLGARVLVADMSRVQLSLNRQHALELGFGEAVEGRLQLDLCEMGALKDETFDVVVCYGGPLSYVFDRRDVAVQEVFRVLRPSGKALFGVMSLWGTVHQFLPDIMRVPMEENADIISTGDLHPDTFGACQHPNHMFRASELRTLLEQHGATVLAMSASNCLSAAWGDRLAEARQDPARWQELLDYEVQACQEPGCLDLGTHLIAVAKKGDAQRVP